MSRVRPGVREVRASPSWPTSALMRLDLPTFERPTTAISGSVGGGKSAGLAAEVTKRYVRYGASPRGAQAMILGAKIRAILDHRYHVAKEDIRALAPAVLRHRLILNFEGQAEGVSTDTVVEEILRTVAQPKMVA